MIDPIDVITTPWGDVYYSELSEEDQYALRRARRRKGGHFDLRTASGRRAQLVVRKVMTRKQDEWENGD